MKALVLNNQWNVFANGDRDKVTRYDCHSHLFGYPQRFKRRFGHSQR
jgi:hypothetical protein